MNKANCLMIVRMLLEDGETEENLDKLLESSENAVETDLYSPHDNEANWLIECNRMEAEKRLRGQPEGTFLIRPRDEHNSYALSIV